MSKLKKSDLLLLLIIILAFVPGLLLYQQLPDKLPNHWNIHGEIDGYSSKSTAVFLLPALNLGLYLLFLVIPKIDPRRKNYDYFSGSYAIMRWALHLFFLAIYFFTLYSGLNMASGTAFDISGLITVGVALLFIVLGNYMGRFRHNYFVGIRTPWTLASEEVWQKTHRRAAKLYVIAGGIGLLGIFFSGTVRALLLLVPLIGVNLYLVGYSYFLFNRLPGEKK